MDESDLRIRSEVYASFVREGKAPGFAPEAASDLNELARRWWWTQLDPDWGPRTAAESEAILNELGLSGPFWQLT